MNTGLKKERLDSRHLRTPLFTDSANLKNDLVQHTGREYSRNRWVIHRLKECRL